MRAITLTQHGARRSSPSARSRIRSRDPERSWCAPAAPGSTSSRPTSARASTTSSCPSPRAPREAAKSSPWARASTPAGRAADHDLAGPGHLRREVRGRCRSRGGGARVRLRRCRGRAAAAGLHGPLSDPLDLPGRPGDHRRDHRRRRRRGRRGHPAHEAPGRHRDRADLEPGEGRHRPIAGRRSCPALRGLRRCRRGDHRRPRRRRGLRLGGQDDLRRVPGRRAPARHGRALRRVVRAGPRSTCSASTPWARCT